MESGKAKRKCKVDRLRRKGIELSEVEDELKTLPGNSVMMVKKYLC